MANVNELDFNEYLCEKYNEANELNRKQRRDEAVYIFEELVDLIDTQEDYYTELTIKIFSNYAQTLASMGRFREASQYEERAFEIVFDVTSEVEIINIVTQNLARYYYKLGRYVDAAQTLITAITTIAEVQGGNETLEPNVLQDARVYAKACIKTQEYDTAIKLDEVLFKGNLSKFGKYSAETIESQSDLAWDYFKSGDSLSAKNICVDILDAVYVVFGKFSEAGIEAKRMLALFTGNCGEIETATSMLWETLAYCDNELGENVDETIQILETLQMMTGVSGKSEDVLFCAKRLRVLHEQKNGSYSTEVINDEYNIASSLSLLERNQESLDASEILLKKAKEMNMDEGFQLKVNLLVAHNLNNVARNEEALKILRYAVPMLEKRCADGLENPLRLHSVKFDLLIALSATGNDEEAIKIADELLNTDYGF